MTTQNALAALTIAAIVVVGCGASDASPTGDEPIPTAGAEDAISPTTTPTAPVTTDDTRSDTTAQDQTMTQISGELTYRQRIALIPGGTATVTVSDVSLQDVASPVLAEVEIALDDDQVPIPFDLSLDTSDLDPRGMYSVRAIITDATGALQWTTDTANLIDPAESEIDLGSMMLVQVAGEGVDSFPESTDVASDDAGSPFVGEWTVSDIDGQEVLETAPATMVFGADGTLGGNGSCNSYSTTYDTTDGGASIGSEIISTMMACPGDVGAQESAFFAVLGDAATAEIVDDGATLLVTSQGGVVVTARR